jgi:hypothetical protein
MKTIDSEEQLSRVRRICLSLPGAQEKLSHGEPTFFAGKVFAMFSNNHHKDGRIALTVPTPPGVQATLIRNWPDIYYYPPYVGCRGWIGILLDRIGDDELGQHIVEAWRLVAPKKLHARRTG